MPDDQLLIPVRTFRKAPGTFTWPTRPSLASVTTRDLLPLKQLADTLKSAGLSAGKVIRDAVSPATIRIRRDRAMVGREAYRLTVLPGGVEILASADAGAYYGVQTLREFIRAQGRRLPCCRVDDAPDFARRGVYHDCSRGKVPTIETLKGLVERLAAWKINELQLYVENVFRFARHPAIGRGFSPFTAEEILELQDFCKLHHVRLVGSLSSFGHMDKILCLPEYKHLAESPDTPFTLCPTNPGSIRLLSEMYDEYLPLHQAPDFNVCCDETFDLGQGRSRRAAKKVGVGRLYLDFLLKIRDLCLRHGKRMNAWADIVLQHPELLKDLPRDIVMLNWDYDPNGGRIPRTHEIADAGMPLMVCPGTNAWVSHGSRMKQSMDNVSTFAAEGIRRGAEGLLNTDWGDGGHRNLLGVSMHGFAHGAAHSWNHAGAKRTDATFTDRFCLHVFGQTSGELAAALRALGATYKRHGWRLFYGTLLEPMTPKAGHQRQMDAHHPEDMRKVLAELPAPDKWPSAPAGAERFEKLAIEDMKVAARMDRLAAWRSIAAGMQRDGECVPNAELTAMADEMAEIIKTFERAWLARSKRSRLADNLKAMRRVEREARRLARK